MGLFAFTFLSAIANRISSANRIVEAMTFLKCKQNDATDVLFSL